MAKKAKPEDGAAALDAAVAAIRTAWDETSIFGPGEDGSGMAKDTLDTGITPLDDILGGGIAMGSIVELYGSEGAGKTTISLQVMVQAQSKGMNVVFIDMENALKPDYAKALGLDMDNIFMSQPSSMEEALDIAEKLIKTGEVGLVVVDSLASLVPSDELSKQVGEQTVGLQARILSQWLRKINPIINKTRTILLFTNQLREKIGMMGYGPSAAPPGGRAVKFYASYRIEVKMVGRKKNSAGDVIGTNLQLTAVKNKYYRPYRHADATLIFGEGIDLIGSIVESAVNLGLIGKRGNWYEFNKNHVCQSYEGELRFNGEKNVRDFLVANPDRLAELKEAMEHL